MKLRSLKLQNFRQHADTNIKFNRGLTGIIGDNGSGKSTILEAIAWALYGKARGTRDSIRFTRAKERSPVKVELEFELSGHRYRVVRGLTTAEVFQDDGESPVANSITGVTELVQRRLGMTRSEFFHTYFTGQKELDAMAALGPTERARFLSRVLGYDRISVAQEFVRERRRELVAEANGVKHGMPDKDAVWRMVEEAEARLAVARTKLAESSQVRERSKVQLESVTPRYKEAQSARDVAQQLISELRVAESNAQAFTRDVERLQGEVASVSVARQERETLEAQLVSARSVREELTRMEALAAADARRQALMERVRTLADEDAKREERLAKLASAPELEKETVAALSVAKDKVAVQEQELSAQRTAWTRDRQEAETRLEALREQYAELEKQRKSLEGLGTDSPCPTCGKPLGESWKSVLELLTTQWETVKTDGNYYRARAAQLEKVPAQVTKLQEQLVVAQQDLAALERKLNRIQNALQEKVSLEEQIAETAGRLKQAKTELAALPAGYDSARHAVLRRDVQVLSDTEKRAARLDGIIENEIALRADLHRATTSRDETRAKVINLETQTKGVAVSEELFAAIKQEYERASSDAQRAELDAQKAAHDVEHIRSELSNAELSRAEFVRLQSKLEELDTDKRLHEELDRSFNDLRTDLNFALRPELSDSGSRFLDMLTDGRYSSIELDDEYRMLVIEDGVPKPVISGGEEDLCNLVLRLAISQMIAERSGQSFSLLVLDEVFGSLDDTRRDNVVALLRRLNDQFEQVIVITHIEQVRDGLDQVLQVTYDEQTGASTVVPGRSSYSDNLTDDLLDSDEEPAVEFS